MRMSRYGIGTPIAVAALAMSLWAGGCGFGGSGDTTAKTARPAARVIVLRGGKHADRALEVLLTRLNPKSPVLPGVWMLPGGPVASDADSDETAIRLAAVRYLAEQAGITVDAAGLEADSEWIGVLADTHYYLALAPADSSPRPNGSLTVNAAWFEPRRALDMHQAGKLPLDYPAIKHLESLVGFANASDALEAARDREVTPVHLRITGEGDKRRAVLPDEAP